MPRALVGWVLGAVDIRKFGGGRVIGEPVEHAAGADRGELLAVADGDQLRPRVLNKRGQGVEALMIHHSRLVKDDRGVAAYVDGSRVRAGDQRVEGECLPGECGAIGAEALGGGAGHGDADRPVSGVLLGACDGVDHYPLTCSALTCSGRADKHRGTLRTRKNFEGVVLLGAERPADALGDLTGSVFARDLADVSACGLGELGGAASNRRHIKRRAMLTVLVFAGLRINELCALRWRDVDLAAGWLHTGSKTDAGRDRVVKIRGALRDELLTLRAGRGSIEQDAYVFATGRGGRMSDDNFRSRVLRSGVGRANENLERADLPPLPDKLTPHSLRRTFCSLLYALGEDPGTVMDEMGHTDPALALRVYRQSMRRGQDEKAQMQALVEGGVWANMGERSEAEPSETIDRRAA